MIATRTWVDLINYFIEDAQSFHLRIKALLSDHFSYYLRLNKAIVGSLSLNSFLRSESSLLAASIFYATTIENFVPPLSWPSSRRLLNGLPFYFRRCLLLLLFHFEGELTCFIARLIRIFFNQNIFVILIMHSIDYLIGLR